MSSSAVSVLIYERASASVQTFWQAAAVLLHRSKIERACVRWVCSVCVSAFLRMWLHTTALCVFPQTCENSVSVCGGYPPPQRKPQLRTTSESVWETEWQGQEPARVCRQPHTDTHSHTQSHNCTFMTLTHLIIDTYCPLRSASCSPPNTCTCI